VNKSLLTNAIATSLILAGTIVEGELKNILLTSGQFALAGGVTNWLAIHMLFEKVPGLYGSGVISARFEEFKSGLYTLVMEEFFNQTTLDRFFSQIMTENEQHLLDFSETIDKTDLSPAFEGLIAAIMDSSLGNMLLMVGGEEAIRPLKDPFTLKMKVALKEIAHSPSFQETVKVKLSGSSDSQVIFSHVEQIVTTRLEELTPQMVKQIIQTMIREHLGWLVVWGGVFGGLIGLITSQLTL
jgi:uncharacterized membrane protein YheB (UPF0754 family)|tara:strand:+ start:647 stop:1369 length:723 start_codon:yes stop_codon:yes gene_type:complete